MRVQKYLKPKILSMITAVICFIMALSCLALPALAETGDNGERVLTVGVPVDRCPVFYVDDDTGEIVGIGVETAEQAEFLRDQGCSEMQGYYFYKPMPAEEYEKLSEEICNKSFPGTAAEAVPQE